jgi:putative cardiolipin synthase
MARPLRWIFALIALNHLLAGCAPMAPRPIMQNRQTADAAPLDTRWHRHFAELQAGRTELSGFHVLNAGVDGIAARVQLARRAERSLDLQYYIYRGDSTGSLLSAELRKAAERGVHVRVLVDDGDTTVGDEAILRLDGYRQIEVRVFNPFDYRGHNRVLRNLDYLLHKSRLDYRMHNKLMIADASVALIGGRNVGDQYFQVDPRSQFADDDVFTVGAAVPALFKSFEEFWNSDQVVPASTVLPRKISHARANAILPHSTLARINSDEPLNALLTDPAELTWGKGRVIYDSPDKREVQQKKRRGRLMSAAVEQQLEATSSELTIASPYFAPSEHETDRLLAARARGVEVRVLTNSLESTPEVAAHSGYRKVRRPMLLAGIRLFETRALLDNTRGSGQGRAISRYGNFALHGKMYVFDKQRTLIGSWNYDQRSLRINTEIGLLMDSPAVADQVTERFNGMVQPEAAYEVLIREVASGRGYFVWDTVMDHQQREFTTEPSRGWWQRFKAWSLSLLPLQPEL